MSTGFIRNWRRRPAALLSALALAVAVAACGDDDDDDTAAPAGTEEAGASASDPADAGADDAGEAVTLRLGYFPNVTHAPAIVGVETGLFQEALGAGVTLELSTFNSGTEVVEAMFSDALDASFIGPNPAINGYARSNGEALRIVAGTTSGGAALVVRGGIDRVEDLAGTRLASPSLGNTQDVALRAWLADQGFETTTAGGGDVSILPQDNADTLTAFQTGAIDGAWVPEPWATRLVNEGGGHVLVNERDIWPDGKFVTTHLIVTTDFLDAHPDVVRRLITGLADAVDRANTDPEAQGIVNDGIEKVTTSRLADATISGAWENLEFTLDPVASSLQKSADDAVGAGLLDPVDLTSPGIYDLTLLNEVLAERGEDAVSGL
jgi:NitT/TauT family transport system substrate-binding protein